MPPTLNPYEFTALLGALEECTMFETDLNGMIIQWVGGPRPVESKSDAEILDRHFSLFFTGRDRDRSWPNRMLEWALSTPRIKDEGWRLRAGEERFWGEHVITAIRDASGQAIGFLNVIFDADRRLAAERAVHEADRRIFEYQRVAELGTFEVDPGTGNFLVTPETLRILGHAAPPIDTADFIPIPSGELFKHIHADDNTRLYFAPQSMHPTRIRIRIVKTDGEVRHIELRSHPVTDREGIVVRRMGTLQDVTDLVGRESHGMMPPVP
jgi:PAS domain-containing protein